MNAAASPPLALSAAFGMLANLSCARRVTVTKVQKEIAVFAENPAYLFTYLHDVLDVEPVIRLKAQLAAPSAAAEAKATLLYVGTQPSDALVRRLLFVASVAGMLPTAFIGMVRRVDRDLIAPFVMAYRIAAPYLRFGVIATEPVIGRARDDAIHAFAREFSESVENMTGENPHGH